MRHARPAFALLDVIVAGLIIGISLAVIIGLTGRALSSQARGEDLQTAAMLADEQLNLVLARGPDGYGRSFPTSGECDPPFDAFTYQLEFAGGAGADPFAVTVTISWYAGGSGALQTVSLQTLIAAREGDDPDPDRKPTETPSRLQ
jgi:type II secretory pathway pseudopilin PulG